jgi:pimeloyl-ACP methyl ester carboxylesterase
MRERMYQPGPARRLPLVIHRAAQGDFAGFMSAPPGGGGRVLADGLYLSITCAESFPYFDYAEAAAASNAGHFGDYRLRRQRDACAVWDVPAAETPTPHAPLQIPTLFVSGDFDPATPPAWAAEAQAAFPVSRRVLLADGGHGPGGLANLNCLVDVQAAFLDAGSFDVFTEGCIATIRRPPFELE